MKKAYHSPQIAVERFTLTQHIASCSAIKINAMTRECVLGDRDTTSDMLNFALAGGFLSSPDCSIIADDTVGGLCYHTSTAMVFTS